MIASKTRIEQSKKKDQRSNSIANEVKLEALMSMPMPMIEYERRIYNKQTKKKMTSISSLLSRLFLV